MAILKNPNFKGKDLMTQWGKLTFDENGEVEISEDAGKKLGTLKGFSFIPNGNVENNSPDKEKSQETKDTSSEISENESENETEANSEAEETNEYTEEELEENTVAQLKKIAKDMGITIQSDAKKKQIIESILENQ